MNYLEARFEIKSGDIIGIEGNSFYSSITRNVQRLAGHGDASNVTHVGVAWWLEGRLYLVEMDGKCNVLRPLSQYKTPFRVWKCPVDSDLMASTFVYMTQDSIHYSMADNILIGFRLLFGLKQHNQSGENCSDFVMRWLKLCNWKGSIADIPSPSEVTIALGKCDFYVK